MKNENAGNETNQTTRLCTIDQAVAHAQHLVDSRPVGDYSPTWVHESSHVGDLSVLALALRS